MEKDDLEAVAALEPVVRRVIRPRVPSASVDDLVQETLVRLSEAAERVPVEDLDGYAVTSALNAAATFHRTAERHRRLQPKLIDLTQPSDPEGLVLEREEQEAVRHALASIDSADRDLLYAHHVEQASVTALADSSGRSEMAVRLRLSRARASLRVDYAVATHGRKLPSERCRPVLVALASGDRRARERLDADTHLQDCDTCADLAGTVRGHRRPMVPLFPALLLWWRGLSSIARKVISVSGATTAVVATVVIGLALQSSTDPPQAVPTTTAPTSTTIVAVGKVRSAGGPLPSSAQGLVGATGQAVTATSVGVLSVPADEGFWIAADDGGRLWVQLIGPTAESPQTISAGTAISFTGTVVADAPDFATAAGLRPGADFDELTEQGHHIAVDYAALRPG